jgi:hypothetical protein
MSQALEIDHIIPLELGGADDDTNLQALCHTHHKEKTRADIKRIAKARRLRKKESPPDQTPRKRRIQSRGFSKTHKKTFSGRVEARQSRSADPDTPTRPPSD